MARPTANRVTAGCLQALVLFACSTASAAPPAAPAPGAPAASTIREWYGWQTLITDGVSASLVIPAATLDDGETFGVAALSGYFAGAPIVHLAHGNYDRVLASVLVRTTLPILLGGGAYLLSGSDGGEYGNPALLVGGGFGIAGAIAIDAALLAYDRVPAPGAAPALAVDLGRGRAVVTVAGRF